MNKQDTIIFIHNIISKELRTTEEFNLHDVEKLVDQLNDIGVLYTDEKEHELRETIALMKLVDMAKEDIENGRVKPAGSVIKEFREKSK